MLYALETKLIYSFPTYISKNSNIRIEAIISYRGLKFFPCTFHQNINTQSPDHSSLIKASIIAQWLAPTRHFIFSIQEVIPPFFYYIPSPLKLGLIVQIDISFLHFHISNLLVNIRPSLKRLSIALVRILACLWFED